MRKLSHTNNGITNAAPSKCFINAHWADIKNRHLGKSLFLITTNGDNTELDTDQPIELLDAIVVKDGKTFVLQETTQSPSADFLQWTDSVREWTMPDIMMADITVSKLKIGGFTHKIIATLAPDIMFIDGNVTFFNEDDNEFYSSHRQYIYCSAEGNFWRRKRSAETLTYEPISKLLKDEMKSYRKTLRKQSF